MCTLYLSTSLDWLEALSFVLYPALMLRINYEIALVLLQ